jgi:hypothetical protein
MPIICGVKTLVGRYSNVLSALACTSLKQKRNKIWSRM